MPVYAVDVYLDPEYDAKRYFIVNQICLQGENRTEPNRNEVSILKKLGQLSGKFVKKRWASFFRGGFLIIRWTVGSSTEGPKGRARMPPPRHFGTPLTRFVAP